MRRPRTRVVLVDAQLRIVAADATARQLLADLGQCEPPRLPDAIDCALREWLMSGGGESDFAAMPMPGLIVRAVRLDSEDGSMALLVERVCAREDLEAASQRFRLSPREVDVLRLLLEGGSACEIAERLAIGECTVGDYIKRIFAKTRVRNRSEMIAKVLGWRTGHRHNAAAQVAHAWRSA